MRLWDISREECLSIIRSHSIHDKFNLRWQFSNTIHKVSSSIRMFCDDVIDIRAIDDEMP